MLISILIPFITISLLESSFTHSVGVVSFPPYGSAEYPGQINAFENRQSSRIVIVILFFIVQVSCMFRYIKRLLEIAFKHTKNSRYTDLREEYQRERTTRHKQKLLPSIQE